MLEKDGREVVGGVVLMRFGENPLEVTRRVKEKISTLAAGLPEGVRIVPFYDRTPLIRKALATVSDTVKEELIICTVAILLVMGHLGGAFVVSITLPLAILFSFLMMKLFGIPSNIMSLAGIAISVGILEDQAVVMTENAAHHLTRHFGNRKVTGNVLHIIIPACRTVGRPIFFSVLITILSFLPVFALTGRSGKMFHPLAWTKTFALIGVAVLAITLVPALIPIFLRGRIKSEDDALARPHDDLDLQADARLADGPDDAGLLALRLHPRRAATSPRPGWAASSCPPLDEGTHPRHADERAEDVGDPGGGRPEVARRRPARVPRGPPGRRQGGPRRDRRPTRRRSTWSRRSSTSTTATSGPSASSSSPTPWPRPRPRSASLEAKGLCSGRHRPRRTATRS